MAGKPQDWTGSDGKARGEVVAFLKARGGEITSDAGLAVVDMQDHLGRSRSLSNLLRTMEHDGMISRDVRGRRTYRITLVDDWGLGGESMASVTALHPSARPATEPDSAVDYGLLAESLLAIVMRKVAEPPASVKPDRVLVDRLRKAEALLGRRDTQLAELSAERDTLRARVAELEEQGRLYEHNMDVLRAELDKPKNRRDGGTPISERLSTDERKLLADLMSSLPETPQSRPRRTRT